MSLTRIGMIGDVHAEHDRLAAAIQHLIDLGAETLICTGDIVDGKGCPNRSIELLQEYNVQTVRGNHDRWVLEGKARHVVDAHHLEDLDDNARDYLTALPLQREFETIAGSLLLCHGIGDNDLKKVWPGTERMGVERSKQLDEIIASERHRFVINGHMHFRTMIHFETLTLINAGTLRGEHWPGFSLLDLEAKEIRAYDLKCLETSQSVSHSKTQKLQEPCHTVFSSTQDFRGDWDPVRLF